MDEVFNVSKSTISEHLKHIFDEGELEENSTVRKIRTLQIEGKGKISSKDAQKIAKDGYDKFKVIQDKHYRSDFDKLIIDIKRVEGVR